MRSADTTIVLGFTWALGGALCASAWLLIAGESAIVVCIGAVLAGVAGAIGGVAMSEARLSPYPQPWRRDSRR